MYKLLFNVDTLFVLAEDSEDAAWQALNLAIDNHWQLIDVIPQHDKETLSG